MNDNINLSPNKTAFSSRRSSSVKSATIDVIKVQDLEIDDNNENSCLNPLSINSKINLNITPKKKPVKFKETDEVFDFSIISSINSTIIENTIIQDTNKKNFFVSSPIFANNNASTNSITTETLEESKNQNVVSIKINNERIEQRTNEKVITVTFLGLIALFILSILYRAYVFNETRNWKTFFYILLLPVAFLLAFSFFNYVVFGFKNLLFSAEDCKINTKYYSCIKPTIPTVLPNITIQIPIYKESFKNVIIPSLESLSKAVNYYFEKGGYANIYVNDDGFATLSEDDKIERTEYYTENNIAWIARPAKNRKGRFKKGSNMNYAINFSKLYKYNLHETIFEDADDAMEMTLEQYKYECEAGGDVVFGDFILLVDSDTIVPESCLYDTIGEFYEENNLAFTQHLTTPLIDDKNIDSWDLMICHFTRMIYELAFIQVTAGGDPSPLVGHNAFIRTKYLEEVAIKEKDNDELKYWNENTVCEDFDLSLRFQSAGYYGRYISYTGKDFMEGVSPTYCDEIVRFKKYSLGTAEITFNPFNEWYSNGIFSKTIKEYLKSKPIPWYSKVLLLSYLCSYYIMALSPLTLVTTILALRFCSDCGNESIFNILIGIIGIFSIFLPFTTAIYRLKFHDKYNIIQKITVIKDEYVYGFKMGLFFGSLGVHMLFSILTYMFNFDEVFLSSRKEKPTWGKIEEFKYIAKSYWKVFAFVLFFEALFVVNYLFGYGDYIALIPPSLLAILHIGIPFFYS
jgi:hypothetical protein